MNIVIFDKKNVLGERIHLTDELRISHIRGILKLVPGDVLNAGELGGARWHVVIEELSQDKAVMRLVEKLQIPKKPNVQVVLALPRPQMLKRVLESAPQLGVGELVLIGSERVEKSYFQSKVLSKEKLQEHLVLGLEQAGTTHLPEVKIIKSFWQFVKKVESGELQIGEYKVMAHPEAQATFKDIKDSVKGATNYCAAIGPEGGWVEREVEQFLKLGFTSVSMGHLIQRVDVALCSFTSQLRLLEDISDT